jgi:acetyl esterase/lipase
MAKELERRGVEHEFIPMAGKEHLFDMDMSDPHVAAAFDRVLSFLRKQLSR